MSNFDKILLGWFFILTFALGFAFSGWGFKHLTHHTENQVVEMVKECEANLPRTQQCKLIAVPETAK